MIFYREGVTSYDVSTKRMINISSIRKKHMNHCKDKDECTMWTLNILSQSQKLVNEEKPDNKVVFVIIRDDILERVNSVTDWECNKLKCFK